jgi:hypothetical protein
VGAPPLDVGLWHVNDLLRDSTSAHLEDDIASDLILRNLDQLMPTWRRPDDRFTMGMRELGDRRPWPTDDPLAELVWLATSDAEPWLPTAATPCPSRRAQCTNRQGQYGEHRQQTRNTDRTIRQRGQPRPHHPRLGLGAHRTHRRHLTSNERNNVPDTFDSDIDSLPPVTKQFRECWLNRGPNPFGCSAGIDAVAAPLSMRAVLDAVKALEDRIAALETPWSRRRPASNPRCIEWARARHDGNKKDDGPERVSAPGRRQQHADGAWRPRLPMPATPPPRGTQTAGRFWQNRPVRV